MPLRDENVLRFSIEYVGSISREKQVVLTSEILEVEAIERRNL